MLQVSDRQLTYLLRSTMKRTGKYQTGTYDRADPTAYEKIEAWVIFEIDPLVKDTDHLDYYQISPTIYHISYMDSTWGIEIKITNDKGEQILGRIYLSMEKNEFHVCSDEGRKFIFAALTEDWYAKKPDVETWLDDWTDYEGPDDNFGLSY